MKTRAYINEQQRLWYRQHRSRMLARRPSRRWRQSHPRIELIQEIDLLSQAQSEQIDACSFHHRMNRLNP